MVIERGKIEGDTEVTYELELRGMITGDAIIKDGGVLHLRGMVCRDLVVEEGGKVFLRGMVSGNTINNGGELEIWGTVVGRLMKNSGVTRVHPEAAIGPSNLKIDS